MFSALAFERVRELLERAGLGGLPPRAVAGALALAVLVLAVALWRFWPAAPEPEIPLQETQEQAVSEDGAASDAKAAEIVVHVAGSVLHPGVYRLAAGSRVDDAIGMAGGGLGNAAIDSINRARILSDGEQVYVPSVEEAAAGGAVAGAASAGTPGKAGAKVNINRASASELEALPGVGPSTAQKIVEDREANGPFAQPEDLMRVSGIGPKKFEAMAEFVICQ